MTSTAIRAQGTTIARGDAASPEVFTALANITGISGPALEASDIDVTNLSSTAKEFLQGLEDAGMVELTGHYDQTNTQHQAMRDAVGSGTPSNFRITLSDSETIDFTARVKAFSMDLAVDGPVEMSMSLKISGAPTFSN